MYNGNYRMFSLVSATISFLPTGLIQRSISFMTFRMEMYATSSDYGRLVLEVLVLLMILVNLYNELKEMLLDDRHRVRRRPAGSVHTRSFDINAHFGSFSGVTAAWRHFVVFII